jgi:hypothetical protein
MATCDDVIMAAAACAILNLKKKNENKMLDSSFITEQKKI